MYILLLWHTHIATHTQHLQYKVSKGSKEKSRSIGKTNLLKRVVKPLATLSISVCRKWDVEL